MSPFLLINDTYINLDRIDFITVRKSVTSDNFVVRVLIGSIETEFVVTDNQARLIKNQLSEITV